MHYPWVSHAAGGTPDAGAAGVQPGSLTLRWRIFPISAGRGVSACQGLFRRAANTAFAELRRHQGGEAADAVFLDSGSAFQGDTARSFLAFSSSRAAVRGAVDGTVHNPVPVVEDDASAADGPGFAAAYRVPGHATGAGATDGAAGAEAGSVGAGDAAFYDALREQLRRIHVPEDFPVQLTGGFALGWVGAFGYELKNLSPDVRASATRRGVRPDAEHDADAERGAENSAEGGAEPLRHHSHPDAALLFADRGLVFSPHGGVVIALALEPTGTSGGPDSAPGDEPLASPAPATSSAPDSSPAPSPAEAWFRQLEEGFGAGLRNLFPAGAEDSNAPGTLPDIALDAAPIVADRASSEPTEYRLDHGHEQYLANVLACQEHIAAGDSYELCLTTTARGPALGDPWGAYQQLRDTSPVPYGAYLQFPGLGAAPATDPGTASPSAVAVNPTSRTAATQNGIPGLHVLSASPERFLRIRRAAVSSPDAPASAETSTTTATSATTATAPGPLFVEAKPIKGTRPRGTGAEDERHRRELQNSEKDRAENLMIVDLLRNDLAKICQPGSVRVPELFAVESYSHVHQLVSTITGELDAGAGADAVDCLAACFPGGSMTGAPKVRSMELLEDLEGTARGLYSGAIGWLSPTGEADLSITIRTLIDDGHESSFGVGGAIVADSDPEAEWQEILVKASALLEALDARIAGSA